MKRIKVLFWFSLISSFGIVAGQEVALKSNTIYWMAAMPNLGIEVRLSDSFSLNLSGNYVPFHLNNRLSLKHWGVQPELRYWFCKSFKGHFIGVHGHYGEYSTIRKDYRFNGNLYGVGGNYGYQWLLSPRWSLEAEIGLGYTRLQYDKLLNKKCGTHLGIVNKNNFGLTKVAVNFIYIIK